MELTIREVEKRTGLSKITVQRYIASGKIQATLKRNRYLIPESELSKLPKPRKTGMQTPARGQEERSRQGTPFQQMEPLEDTPMPIQLMGTLQQNIRAMEIFLVGYQMTQGTLL